MIKKGIIVTVVLLLVLFVFLETYTPPLSDNHGKISTELFLGETENQPLIVGFGGGEGGNAWASDYWQETRNIFIDSGYAFLAVGYFGMQGTPASLDRISLNAIHDAITEAAQHPKVNQNQIAIIGGSKGGELVLNLASRYNDFSAVIALASSHVSFPATTAMANTSSWTYNDEEVTYVTATYSTVPHAIKGDLYSAFTIMLEDKEAVKNATIEVEKINGPILLLSGDKDDQWPSSYMSDQVIARLKSNNFKHYHEHIKFDGGHTAPLKHFNVVIDFLDQHFKSI